MCFMAYFLVDRKRDIELYCAKCYSISSPTTISHGETCGLCNTSIIYQSVKNNILL